MKDDNLNENCPESLDKQEELAVIKRIVKKVKKELNKILGVANHLEDNVDQPAAIGLFNQIRSARESCTELDKEARNHRKSILPKNRRPYKKSRLTGNNISNLKNLNN